MKPKKTQKETILKHLEDNPTITSWEAITKYRITRLSAYIKFLEEDGIQISRRSVTKDGKTFTEYWLAGKEHQSSMFEEDPEDIKPKNAYEGGF